MKKRIVTIHKVEVSPNNWYYNIYDEEVQEYIDGFRKKYQAIDAIERWGLIRKDKKMKVYYY